MSPASRHGGTVLFLVLVVLLILTIAVGAMQRLTLETHRQARVALGFEDQLHRADGILAMFVSRWKKELRYQAEEPLTSLPGGSETGEWDSHRFCAGWERAPLATRDPTYRMAVWVRFPEERPGRTFHYDLALRIPSTLESRVAELRGLRLSSIDPADAAARRGEFRSREPAVDEVLDREASVEAYTSRAEVLANQDLSVQEVERALGSGTLEGEIRAMRDLLAARAEVEQEALPSNRRRLAEQALAVASGLPAEVRVPWVDAARYALAREIVAEGETLPRTGQLAAFEAASKVLEQIVDGSPECCGIGRAAWRLANLRMRIRKVLSDAAELSAAKARARQGLAAVAQKLTGSFVTPRSDVIIDELPDFVDSLWKSRVAASLNLGRGGHLLVSTLNDGSAPVVHLEARDGVVPLGWAPDGSSIYVTLDPRAAAALPGGQTIWRASLDGSEISRLFAQPVKMPANYQIGPSANVVWKEVVSLEPSGSGEMLLVEGLTEVPPLTAFTVIRPGSDEAVAMGPHEPQRTGLTNLIPSPAGTRILAEYHSTDPNLSPSVPQRQVFEIVADPWTGGGGPPLVVRSNPRDLIGVGGTTWIDFGGGRELIAYVTQRRFVKDVPTQTIFHFLDPNAPSSPEITVSSDLFVSTALDPHSQNVKQYWPHSAFVPSPPGFLWAEDQAIYFVSLPDPAARPIVRWPRNADQLGQIERIMWLQAPPFGKFAFFTAALRGEPASRLYVLDLTTGDATIVAGPGGTFPGASAVLRAAVSPIPQVTP